MTHLLNFTHAAYIRCLGSKVYYVNKQTQEIRLLDFGARELYCFDLAL